MYQRLFAFLTALLALFLLCQAEEENQLRLYQWSDGHCIDMPRGSNIDIKLDECHKGFYATSIKVTPDHKRQAWLQRVNDGSEHCYVSFHSDEACSYREIDVLPLPEAFSRCYTPKDMLAVRSVKWYCNKIDKAVTSKIMETSVTGTSTSWTISNNDHIDLQTSTWTSAHNTTVAVLPTAIPGTERSTMSCPNCLAPPKIKRDDSNANTASSHAVETYVHLRHPWADTALCFHCYMKKSGEFKKLECRSGHGHDNRCSPAHYTTPFPATKTESVIAHEKIYTWTSTVSARSHLEARSWHKKVHFKHPFANQQICADAEWEKRGKPKTQIRLQKIKFDKEDKDCEHGMDLDLPIQATVTITGYTTFATTTVTVTAHAEAATAEVADVEEAAEAQITHRDL